MLTRREVLTNSAAALAGAAVADGDVPVVEQVAAEGGSVVPVVVLLTVTGL